MKLPSRFHLHVHAFNACWLYTDEYFITFLILNMPSGTRIPKPKTKKLGHKITSLYRSTKFTQLHDVGIKEIISSGDGAFHSQCEVFPRREEIAEEHEQHHSNEVKSNRRDVSVCMYLLPDSAVAHVG